MSAQRHPIIAGLASANGCSCLILEALILALMAAVIAWAVGVSWG